ncbi:SDR family NAD(P)-dependent oxidoreductase [Sinimarinibacterium flocculans]|uniref:SDR family NAD(P)-dependent oxidoreductase n=1 Tax=Sinimarinibacterium flocculans TaxID=985250 RepID=UPI002493AC2A|nr:SDR family oxidoreductase [Sinimarinibacterium flocculans]
MSDKGGIIVTGASRGIGAAIAEHLAAAGYAVGCVSRSGDLPRRADAPDAVRARWQALKADVTDAAQLKSAFDAFAARVGRVRGLVNNAGLHIETPADSVSAADWQRVQDTNTLSVLLASQAAYPHLVAAQGALVVNIGSFFDRLGVKRNLAYCASKAAVAAMTRVLAVEWAGKRIRAMNVAPGYIVTDLNREQMEAGPLRAYLDKRIPGREPGTADDVGRLVAALYASDIGFLSGETIYIDGAQGIAH